MLDRRERHLELNREHRGGADRLAGRVDGVGIQCSVRARGHDDRVLSIRSHGDERGPGHCPPLDLEVGHVDAGGREACQDVGTVGIVADTADEGDLRAGAGRGNGLIRPFSARNDPVLAREDRLPGLRAAGEANDEVYVRAPENDDSCGGHGSGQDARNSSRAASSSSASSISAAATFSSRWSGDDVPGIGSMTGDRRRSQASAI